MAVELTFVGIVGALHKSTTGADNSHPGSPDSDSKHRPRVEANQVINS